MKKLTASALLLGVIGLAFNLSAQEEQTAEVKRFFFGGELTVLDQGVSASSVTFGFLLFHNNRWNIRNHIAFSAARIHNKDAQEYDILNLNEKISIGSITRNGLFRYYGYFEGGFGVYGTESKELFTLPLMFHFGLGGGLDIFARDTLSFFIEMGARQYIVDAQWLFKPAITAGLRVYF